MRICICGSMSLIDRIEELGDRLRAAGHEVVTPVRNEADQDWHRLPLDRQVAAKAGFIDDHLDEIRRADAVLLANFAAKGVRGYVGANTLMEAAFAKALDIPVHLLDEPGPQPCQIEVLAIACQVLHGDAGAIGQG